MIILLLGMGWVAVASLLEMKNNNENQNSETNYSKDDYSQFNKIIKTENQEKNQVEAKNKKVKVIDFNKLNESNKKIKNKVGIARDI